MKNASTGIKMLIGITIGAILFAMVVGGVLYAFEKESDQLAAAVTTGADPQVQRDYLHVEAIAQSVDPIKGEMAVRLVFTPQGALAGEGGWFAGKDLHILTNGVSGNEVRFERGQRIAAVDTVLSLYDGLYADYPFDVHQADLQIHARVADDDAPEKEAPLRLDFRAMVQGFSLESAVSSRSTDYFGDIHITIYRSMTTIAMAVFIMALLWLLSLAVLGVTVSILVLGRKNESPFGSLGWMGAMLFAFVAFRNAAPGVPPFGALIDYLSFFWAEEIIAACTLLMALNLLRTMPKN
jgi:hypothetical protein